MSSFTFIKMQEYFQRYLITQTNVYINHDMFHLAARLHNTKVQKLHRERQT